MFPPDLAGLFREELVSLFVFLRNGNGKSIDVLSPGWIPFASNDPRVVRTAFSEQHSNSRLSEKFRGGREVCRTPVCRQFRHHPCLTAITSMQTR